MKISHILSLLLIFLFISSFSHGQTCENTKQAPFSCPTCKTCTGSSLTCCNVDSDTISQTLLNILATKTTSQDCLNQFKEYSCSRCDPKNQKLPWDINGLVMCKAKCLTLEKVCGVVLNLKCDSAPESNCWSSANSILHLVVDLKIVLALVLSFICHLI